MDIATALEQECEALGSVLRALDDSDYELVTNCPPWNLKELVAHVLGSTCIDLTKLSAPSADAPVIAAADYYRRPERNDVSYRQGNVDRWQRVAKRFATGRDVAEAFDVAWPKTVAAVRAEDLSRLVAMWGPAMTLGDYLVSRVIGVAAHGVDVAITLGRPTWTTTEALDAIVPTLRDLLGTDPPDALRWTDQDLLEVGTGRRQPSEEERTILGPLADRLPLLS